MPIPKRSMPSHAMSCHVMLCQCVLFVLLSASSFFSFLSFLLPDGMATFCKGELCSVNILADECYYARLRSLRAAEFQGVGWLKFYFSLDKPELDSHVAKCMIGQCTVVSVVCKRRCCSMIMNTIHCLRHRVQRQRGIWQVMTSRGKLDRDPSSASRENPKRLEQSLVRQELLHWIVESLLHQKLSKCIIVIIRILYHIIICYCHFQPPGSIGGFLLRFCLWQID